MSTALEAQVAQFIKAGQSEKAVHVLYQLALASAQAHDFVQAEVYRDQIYKVDAMALSSIVKVNEAIEAQKSKMLTQDFRRLWAPMFEKFSKEAAHAFFFNLKHLSCESEKLIIRQGRPNAKLYLIHHGHIKIIYADKDKELLIDTLGGGDIIGQDSFFSVNVSTVDVKTLTPVRLSYLDRATLDRLKANGQICEEEIDSACRFAASIADRLRRKGLDRRSEKRFNLHVKITFELLSSDSKNSLKRKITAELWDISKSGLSFYFQSKNRKAIRSLIGRTLGVRFNLDIEGQSKSVAVTGIVHGIESHPLDEYSVHLKLKRHFSDAVIQAIQKSAA